MQHSDLTEKIIVSRGDGNRVFPAKAGIQDIHCGRVNVFWIPAFAGMTLFLMTLFLMTAFLLKSVRQIAVAHEVQLVNYLVATGKPVGLLLNFAEKKVDVKRKVRNLDEITG